MRQNRLKLNINGQWHQTPHILHIVYLLAIYVSAIRRRKLRCHQNSDYITTQLPKNYYLYYQG